jgi:SMODS-associating 2TM, beta-strand rich effector domain
VHPYSVDSGERFRVTALIVALGVGLAYIIHVIQDAIGVSWPWWFDGPAAVGTGTMLYNLFDRWGWRVKAFRLVDLVATPDFSGDWLGGGFSSHDDHQSEFQANMSIRQRWTAIKITLETATSRSESQIAAININEGGNSVLRHTYVNRPQSGAIDAMNMHCGTATLRIDSSLNAIEGEYYTGRGRLTEGRLSFRRQKKT